MINLVLVILAATIWILVFCSDPSGAQIAGAILWTGAIIGIALINAFVDSGRGKRSSNRR